ncbi:NUDIX hydrolase [Candidatus Woesearchaeota archaeon]|nr:NUDIX hydrolase [Candidatus Woesearchaeota archaeon]MBW3016095.1 NUDIX hydrolase [Candidatus Woesearchaeota archaeon]
MKKIYEGKYITLTSELIGSNVYERALLMPSVQVIPVVDGRILMIKEHRKEEGCSRWKFVSGFLDKGLSAEQTAQEELMEEAGFSAGRLEVFHNHDPKHTFIIPITYFLAYDLKEDRKPNPDGDIVEEVKYFSIDELYQRLLDGEFDFLHEASVILKLYRDRKKFNL